MSKNQIEQLKDFIEKRRMRSNEKGRSLSVSIDKMSYSNSVSVGSYNKKFDNALFVGVGHGHDVLMHLINGYVDKVDGVDPYYALDGNDDLDYENLVNLTQDLGLNERLTIYKETIQTYLSNCKKNYDLIVLPDVLHHIFVTEKLALKTMLDVESDELTEAMMLAEKVGNSIYRIEWDGDKLLISSTKNNESVFTEIAAVGTDRKATVEISLPISKLVSREREVIILYDDEKPVIFANEQVTVLRAPRLGV